MSNASAASSTIAAICVIEQILDLKQSQVPESFYRLICAKERSLRHAVSVLESSIDPEQVEDYIKEHRSLKLACAAEEDYQGAMFHKGCVEDIQKRLTFGRNRPE